jgi:hypothetical protein
MKLKNLTDLAEFLKSFDNDKPRRKLGFDMQWAYENRDLSQHECGSACCIGGWVQYHNKDTRKRTVEGAVLSISPEGTPWEEVNALCYPSTFGGNGWNATPQQAARAVEILRDTGKCDWERAFEEVPA